MTVRDTVIRNTREQKRLRKRTKTETDRISDILIKRDRETETERGPRESDDDANDNTFRHIIFFS